MFNFTSRPWISTSATSIFPECDLVTSTGPFNESNLLLSTIGSELVVLRIRHVSLSNRQSFKGAFFEQMPDRNDQFIRRPADLRKNLMITSAVLKNTVDHAYVYMYVCTQDEYCVTCKCSYTCEGIKPDGNCEVLTRSHTSVIPKECYIYIYIYRVRLLSGGQC